MWLDYYDNPMDVFDNPITLDLETTIRNVDIGKLRASSFYPDNKIVCLGLKTLEAEPAVRTPKDIDFLSWCNARECILLVGQNIKFDLLWLLREYPTLRKALHKFCIWDTQLAEYLLTGQDHKMASLDQLAEKYGGTLKDDRIKEFWKAGVDTCDIPYPMLAEYQGYDVINTEIVFLEQIDIILREGLFPLTMTQMDALMATTEMEYNGMKFDKELAIKLSEPLMKEAKTHQDVVTTAMLSVGIPESVVNVGSNQQISALFFGGKVKYREQDYILDSLGDKTYYKGGARKGEAKMKYFDKIAEIPAMCTPVGEKGKNGSYPVGDEQLGKLKKSFEGDVIIEQLVDSILAFRKLEKDVNTYYIGYAGQVHADGCIHGNYNHTKTGTGRLSSSAPNLQNISN